MVTIRIKIQIIPIAIKTQKRGVLTIGSDGVIGVDGEGDGVEGTTGFGGIGVGVGGTGGFGAGAGGGNTLI